MPNKKEQEEAKREKAWDPKERWKVLQETIAWMEANLPLSKNAIALASRNNFDRATTRQQNLCDRWRDDRAVYPPPGRLLPPERRWW